MYLTLQKLSAFLCGLSPKLFLLYRGQAQYQELGYGPNGKKSSANPEKCFALENVYTHQVCQSSSATFIKCDSREFHMNLYIALMDLMCNINGAVKIRRINMEKDPLNKDLPKNVTRIITTHADCNIMKHIWICSLHLLIFWQRLYAQRLKHIWLGGRFNAKIETPCVSIGSSRDWPDNVPS